MQSSKNRRQRSHSFGGGSSSSSSSNARPKRRLPSHAQEESRSLSPTATTSSQSAPAAVASPFLQRREPVAAHTSHLLAQSSSMKRRLSASFLVKMALCGMLVLHTFRENGIWSTQQHQAQRQHEQRQQQSNVRGGGGNEGVPPEDDQSLSTVVERTMRDMHRRMKQVMSWETDEESTSNNSNRTESSILLASNGTLPNVNFLLPQAPAPTPPPTPAPTPDPTPAPTQFSYFQGHEYNVVHVIHTPFMLQALGPSLPDEEEEGEKTEDPEQEEANEEDTSSQRRRRTTRKQQEKQSRTAQRRIQASMAPPSALAWAQFETWKYVTLPSLVKQTSSDFLYIVWVQSETLHLDIRQALIQTLESSMEHAMVLDISTVPDHKIPLDLRTHAWYQDAKRVPQAWMGGLAPVTFLLHYALASQTRPLLETTLLPTDALYKEFVVTIQKEASKSLVLPTSEKIKPKPHFQIWCSNLYLEWYLENPWNPKGGKRGILLGQMGLQSNHHAGSHHFLKKLHAHHSHKEQQCDFDSGLTIGSTEAMAIPVSYSVTHGIQGVHQAKNKQAATESKVSWKSKLRHPFQENPNLLPNCVEDHPHNCLRYLDVGLNEYGVLRTRHWAAVDLLDRVDVIMADKENHAETTKLLLDHHHDHSHRKATNHQKHLIPLDLRWRSVQDHIFSILSGRFGVDPKQLSSHLKPMLIEQEIPIVTEQYQIQQLVCHSKNLLSTAANHVVRRLGRPAEDDVSLEENLNSFAAVETSVADAVLASSFVPKDCNVASLHAIEVRYQEIQKELGEQRQDEKERAQQAAAKAAAEASLERARERAKAAAAASFTRNATKAAGDAAAAVLEPVRLLPYQHLPTKKPQRTVKAMTKWKNSQNDNIVHVVHTRFMQHQAQLVNLGKARIDLFQTFTVPSMRHQTTQDFLWIVWTDPKLEPQLLYGLMEELKDFPNAVIVGNSDIVSQDFRQSMNGLLLDDQGDGKPAKTKKNQKEKKQIDQKTVLWGSRSLLMDYFEASQTRILLETRLDADDALSHNFLETVQSEATNSISKTDLTDYRVWCANRFIDWRYYSPDEDQMEAEGNGSFLEQQLGTVGGPKIEKGYLAPEQDLKSCVTVGLTIGFQTEADLQQLPTKEHHKIRQSLPSCKDTAKHCARGLYTPENQFYGLRARTPTSTSMVNVVSSEEATAAAVAGLTQFKLWQTMQRDFYIPPTTVWDLRQRFQANLPDILLDSIAGLCKAGHSCRRSSKDTLMQLLKQAVAEASAAELTYQQQSSGQQSATTKKASSRTAEQAQINDEFAALAAEMKQKKAMPRDPVSEQEVVKQTFKTGGVDEDESESRSESKSDNRESSLPMPKIYQPRNSIPEKEQEKAKQSEEDIAAAQKLLLGESDAIGESLAKEHEDVHSENHESNEG